MGKEIGQTILTIGELKKFIEDYDLKDNDLVVLEAIDLETGDVSDLHSFHMDVIDNVRLTNGDVVKEVRFCQEPHENVQSPSMEDDFINDEELISMHKTNEQ